MTTTIREIATRFNSRTINAEQAERIHAVRHAAAGFAAVVFQAVADCGEREGALASVDAAFLLVRAAIEREQAPAGKDGTAERLALLDKVEESKAIGRGDLAALRAFVGVVDPEPLGDKKKKSKDS